MKETKKRTAKSIFPLLLLLTFAFLMVIVLLVRGQARAGDLDADTFIPIVIGSSHTPTATATQIAPTTTPNPTNTQTSPTRTPTGSATAPPNSTPTQMPASPTATVVSEGACAPADHNPNEWHGLYNSDLNCHYDHEHKHDPNEVTDIFGPAGAWFGGTSLSYPWETPNENLYKHNVYGWVVRRDIPSLGRPIWTKDFRWQFHATSAPMLREDGTLHGGYLSRFHSFSLETQVCNAGGSCGIVRTGGWVDNGNLELRENDIIYDCVFLEHEPSQQEACSTLGRRRIHFYYPGVNTPNKSTFFWYGRIGLMDGELPALHPFQTALATNDGSVNLIPDDLYNLHFFCPEWDCPLNNSTIQAHVLNYAVRSDFDPDNNGIAEYNGYTDRYGVVAPNCTTVGPDCVPLIIEHAPVGILNYRDDDIGIGTAGTEDFDISPAGEWWIRFPN